MTLTGAWLKKRPSYFEWKFLSTFPTNRTIDNSYERLFFTQSLFKREIRESSFFVMAMK
jgi:hypothetical protein